MLTSKRLEPIVNLAQRDEDKEAQAMGKRQSAVSVSEQQLESLTLMRSDYLQKFQSSGTQVSALQLQEFRRFMNKLDMAIGQQHVALRQSRQQFEQQKTQWVQAHARSRSLQTVTDHRKTQELHAAEKKEQQETDACAQRAFAFRQMAY